LSTDIGSLSTDKWLMSKDRSIEYVTRIPLSVDQEACCRSRVAFRYPSVLRARAKAAHTVVTKFQS